MIRAVLFLGIFWAATSASAEDRRSDSLNITEFLSTAKTDYRLRNHQQLVDYLGKAKTSTPYLEKIELRTETDDFDLERQRYTLRFYPKGWGETSANRQLEKASRRENELDHQVIFENALKDRYDLILEHREVTKLIEIAEKLRVVFADRISVMRKLSASSIDFDVTALISAENSYVDLELDLVKLKDRLTLIEHKITERVGRKRWIDFAKPALMPITKIKALAGRAEIVKPETNAKLRNRAHKVELAQIKYDLEVAKNRDYLNFLSVEFDTQNVNELRRAFSLELAVELPLTRSDQYDINRRKAAHLDEQLRYEEERRQLTENMVSLTHSLKRLLRQHQILSRRKFDDDAKTSFNKYIQLEGTDPLVLLKLKESILKGDWRLAELESSIYDRYLDLLDLWGTLTQRPLRNHLSASREPIP